MNEGSQVRGCYNITFQKQKLTLNDDLLLQGLWGKGDAAAQRTRFNTSDN